MRYTNVCDWLSPWSRVHLEGLKRVARSVDQKILRFLWNPLVHWLLQRCRHRSVSQVTRIQPSVFWLPTVILYCHVSVATKTYLTNVKPCYIIHIHFHLIVTKLPYFNNLFLTHSVLFHREYFWRIVDKRKTNIGDWSRINVRFHVLIGMSMKMVAFRKFVSCGSDRRFRGSYCLLLMESVSNNLQLNPLLSSIKSSWITIVKSDAETGLTSRYLAIIMMVVYLTRWSLTQECLCSKTTEW
jgi:hypothetical protein